MTTLEDQFQFPLLRTYELGQNASFYDRLIAAPSDDDIMFTFSLWSSLIYLMAIPTTAIFLSVILTPQIRKCPFNLFLIFLMIPDLGGLWFCATSCLVNAAVGHYTTVEHCRFQAFCLIWSIGANAWMNTIITRHLWHMLSSSKRFRKYQPPTHKQVLLETLGVYGWGMFLGSWFVFEADWWPFKCRLVWGTLCLPRAVDDRTNLWLYGCFFPLWFGIPLVYVCGVGYCIWKQQLLPAKGRRRVLAIYFARLMLSFLIMWIPCLILFFVASAWGNWAHVLGGLWGHLQAMVSACISLMKPDIWKAFVDFYHPCCCSDFITCFVTTAVEKEERGSSADYIYDWQVNSVAERSQDDEEPSLWMGPPTKRKTARMTTESFLGISQLEEEGTDPDLLCDEEDEDDEEEGTDPGILCEEEDEEEDVEEDGEEGRNPGLLCKGEERDADLEESYA